MKSKLRLTNNINLIYTLCIIILFMFVKNLTATIFNFKATANESLILNTFIVIYVQYVFYW